MKISRLRDLGQALLTREIVALETMSWFLFRTDFLLENESRFQQFGTLGFLICESLNLGLSSLTGFDCLNFERLFGLYEKTFLRFLGF